MSTTYLDRDAFYGGLKSLLQYWDNHVLGKTGPRLHMDFDGMIQSVRLGYHLGKYEPALAELSGWRALMAKRSIVVGERQTPLRQHAFYVARKLQDLERMVETQVSIVNTEPGVERQR